MNVIPTNLIEPIAIFIAVMLSIAAFFFVVTRLSLIIQSRNQDSDPDTSHIYWIYKNPVFIKMADHMFVVSSILLLQYSKLVSTVVKRLNPSLKGKRILQVSCAFGNVSEKIAESCARQGAEEFVLTDIMQSELDNAKSKLTHFGDLCSYSRQDATQMDFEDQSFDYVVAFFLPHELPYEKKELLINECNRLVKPGGRVVFGEFHKPRLKVLEILGRLYFKIFEPYATEMWDNFDLGSKFKKSKYKIIKDTYLFDNFQVLTAERIK